MHTQVLVLDAFFPGCYEVMEGIFYTCVLTTPPMILILRVRAVQTDVRVSFRLSIALTLILCSGVDLSDLHLVDRCIRLSSYLDEDG